MVRELERTARVRATGLVSNTHMMDETTTGTVREGVELALETARRLGLPLVAAAVQDTIAINGDLPCPLFVLHRIVTPPFEAQPQARTTGPLFVVN
jgi:hypothetical protein